MKWPKPGETRSILNSPIIIKFFSVIFVCTSLLYIFFQGFLLKGSTDRIVKNEREAYLYALQNGNAIVNEYFDGIANMIFLLEKLIDIYGPDDLEEFLVKYKSQMSIYSKNIYFIDPAKKVYCTDPALFAAYGNEQILDFHEKSKASPSIGFSDPYDSWLSSETLAVYYPLNSGNGRFGGTIVVEIDLEYFRSRLKAALTPNTPTLDLILVTSYDDYPIAYYASADSPLLDTSRYAATLKEGLLKSVVNVMINQDTEMLFQGEALMVYSQSLIRAPFNLCLLAGKEKYRSLFDSAKTDFLLNATIGTLLIIVAAILLTAYTTKPLRSLVAEMDKVGSLSDLKPIMYQGRDEFGVLVRSYNALLARICGLIDDLKQSENQKKMLELKTLQSQIGPHFLYNTLACFGSLAKQGKLERLREGIKNLIFLLGYSFDRIDDKVILEEETRILLSYCEIQKLRYGEVFAVELRISPETAGCKLPKLILQPIVENAIFHGILPKGGQGLVSISSEKVEGNLVITIRDDGIGMNPDQLSKLFSGYTDTNFNKIGIKNVDERIKLNYGEDYGLAVLSRENAETIVTIVLPIE
jgi:two-component system sensor histidine kinase YesM